ncbi:uncharacterized protein TA16470 [Theileria annulata]|uniref:Uncharacterized protein n=1 Tax=Theileria annulata TaxID=5874 RepID=Q4UIW9_THEAN|nr:uncharacterized protein TA16470 [Theileria annulata]CAI72970.1 hypothetical protein TA16470 [Theileria annulata]|eukprot:XP_953648.1 hypothetical protein TA16470 [Theileria annulata]
MNNIRCIISKVISFNSFPSALIRRRYCTISFSNFHGTLPFLNHFYSDFYTPKQTLRSIDSTNFSTKCYSSSRDSDGPVIESGREFDEIQQQLSLSEFASNYWRSLRLSKPFLLTFNVDKSVEARLMDAVMGSGVFCKNVPSLDTLFETILQYKETKDLIGCYMNLDNNYDAFLNMNKDLFEKIKLSCNSLFLDVTYTYYQSVDDYMKTSKIINLINPHVIRFCSGTLKFLLNTDLECPLLKENSTKEDFSLERCYYLSEKYNSTVIDSSDKIAVSNHNNMEMVVFPKLPQILNKIHGMLICNRYNNCSGAIIASMTTLSSEDFLVPSSAAIYGLDFVSSESAKKANGPGSMVCKRFFIFCSFIISSTPYTTYQCLPTIYSNINLQ